LPRATRGRRFFFRRAAAASAAILAAALLALLVRDNGEIYGQVYVSGVHVGGQPRDICGCPWVEGPHPAMPPPDTPIVVRARDTSYRCKLEDAGVSFDLEQALDRAYAVGRTGPPLEQFFDRLASYLHRIDISIPAVVDDTRASAFARDCARRLNRRPKNASITVGAAQARITPGKPGIAVTVGDVPAAVKRWADSGCRGELRLPARLTGTLITAEQLRSVDTVLASVRTSLSGSSRNRRHNIALAAAAVSGHVLMPGETFSYNRVVGPRIEESGYRTAPVIRNGKLVPGTGGGACQLSSTLYQTALRAGLEIVARSHHSRPVAYTPPGFDATVVYPVIDLKFRNPFGGPVVLRAAVRSGRLECQVLGHGPAPRIELARQVRWIQPPQPRIVEDAALPPGQRVVEVKARRGVRVRVYRRPPGGAAGEGQLVSTDYYSAEGAVIRWSGPAGPVPGAAVAGPGHGSTLGSGNAAPAELAAPQPAPGGRVPIPGGDRPQGQNAPKKRSDARLTSPVNWTILGLSSGRARSYVTFAGSILHCAFSRTLRTHSGAIPSVSERGLARAGSRGMGKPRSVEAIGWAKSAFATVVV
jgi:vancomycin resistance protein YoaR